LKALAVKIFGASTEPNASFTRRPVVAAFGRKLLPAALKPIAACPCPETTTDGIQYQWADEPDGAGSKIVPD